MRSPAAHLAQWMEQPAILRAALCLSAYGVAVHWLRAPSGGEEDGRGKAPLYRDWQRAPWQGAEQLRKTYVPGCNVGIHTGRVRGARCPLLIVDCDDAEAVRYANEKLPSTPLRVRTRQGEHWYFQRPRTEERCPNRAKVGGLRLDVRCDEGNVVVAPSIHPSGFQYEFLGPLLPEVLDALPVFDYAWLPPAPAPAAAPVLSHPANAWQPEERRTRRARGLARKWQVNERGQGQGTDAFKLAGFLLHTLGLTAEATYQVMASEYNPRCPQPYAEAELRRKVEQARSVMRDRRPRLADEAPAR